MSERERSASGIPQDRPDRTERPGTHPVLPPLWRRPRWRKAALGAGLFICGFFLGAGATLGGIRHRALSILRNPEELPSELLEHWCDDLDLTEEQEEEVLGILKKKHLAFMDAVREAFDSTQGEVAALLTEAQAARWNKDMDRRRENIFGPGARE